MPGSIGSISPDTWRGSLMGPRSSVETFTRSGVDHTGLIIGALHPITCEIETVSLCATDAAAKTLMDSMESMVGTIVTATDDCGRSFVDTAIMSVRTKRQPCRGITGITAMVVANWSLLPDTL